LYLHKGQKVHNVLAAALVYRCKPDTVVIVRWAIAGQLTGTEWHVCRTCGMPRLASIDKDQTCMMTPMCRGKMERIRARPYTSAQLRAQLVAAHQSPRKLW
jgi:hypothetical protein